MGDSIASGCEIHNANHRPISHPIAKEREQAFKQNAYPLYAP